MKGDALVGVEGFEPGTAPFSLTGVPKVKPVEDAGAGAGPPNVKGEPWRSPAGGVAGGAPNAKGLAGLAASALGAAGGAGEAKVNPVPADWAPNKGFGAATASVPPEVGVLPAALDTDGAPKVKGGFGSVTGGAFCAGCVEVVVGAFCAGCVEVVVGAFCIGCADGGVGVLFAVPDA